jgi:hypothetical protein
MDYQTLCPVGTKVGVVHPVDSEEQGWTVIPAQAIKKLQEGELKLPEGWELASGWGEVTSHDAEHPRANNGTQPIVVQWYIYCAFVKELWEALS